MRSKINTRYAPYVTLVPALYCELGLTACCNSGPAANPFLYPLAYSLTGLKYLRIKSVSTLLSAGSIVFSKPEKFNRNVSSCTALRIPRHALSDSIHNDTLG